jgi:ribosomal-protein-alanine N-acetyltransferase
MAKTLIRHAAGADFKILLEIDEASFPPGVAYDSTELQYFMNRRGAETLVLEADGGIAAFLILGVDRNRRRATIVTLDVRPEHQRRGYATQLLMRAEEILKDHGAKAYDLQVDVGNTGAIEFYKKHGFEVVRLLRNYYPNGHDAYLMVKGLNSEF